MQRLNEHQRHDLLFFIHKYSTRDEVYDYLESQGVKDPRTVCLRHGVQFPKSLNGKIEEERFLTRTAKPIQEDDRQKYLQDLSLT